MNGRYAVFVLAFLLTISATSVAFAQQTGGLLPVNVDTHGPRVSSVTFSVISSDSPLEGALSSGGIQAAEWTFTVSSYGALLFNSDVLTNSTTSYAWSGLAFNTVHPYMNNVHFRQAIAELTDYSYILTTVCSGAACVATPDVMPCVGYGFMCGNEPGAYAYDLSDAAVLLAAAGLHPSLVGVAIDPRGAGPSTTWCTVSALPCPSNDVFNPTLQWRSDDPLLTGAAGGLIAAAGEIGLTFHQEGIAGSGGLIYAPSAEAVISPGVYNPKTGYNSAPVFNATDANSTADSWDMYTYSCVTSVNFEPQAEFWNSAFTGTSINFVNFYNRSMDYYSNRVLHAYNLTAADTAAIGVAKVEMQQLPYLNWYFENTLYADYISGWTGYALEPATGPNTGAGIYYTLLNVHSTTNSTGGNLDYAIHQQADEGGMNPMYNANWVWQVDLWSEVYDSPLVTPPTQFTTVNAFLKYMVTSYSVKPFGLTKTTGFIPYGSFDFQPLGVNGIPAKVSNGTEITFDFARNITFSDGVPFTAKDYQESLYLWDLALSPSLKGVDTPDRGLLAGPYGLLASKVTVNSTIDSISLYINSKCVWNLADVVVPVLPQHILQYFNPDHFSTALAAVDTTLPYLLQPLYSIIAIRPPLWVTYEPSMEIGTGPFMLTNYSHNTGDGVLTANPNYFRSAWYAGMPSVTPGSSYINIYTIQLFINNPTTSLYCGVPSSSQGFCGIVGSSVKGESSLKTTNVVTLERCTVTDPETGAVEGCNPVLGTNGRPVRYSLVQGIVLTCSKHGIPTGEFGGTCPTGDRIKSETYTDNYELVLQTGATKKAAALPPGNYEVVLQTQFTFQGLARVWYQYTGFTVT